MRRPTCEWYQCELDDQGQIKLLEKPPGLDRYEVLVTFLAPQPAAPAKRLRALVDLKGIWSGIDLSLEDIQASEYRVPENFCREDRWILMTADRWCCTGSARPGRWRVDLRPSYYQRQLGVRGLVAPGLKAFARPAPMQVNCLGVGRLVVKVPAGRAVAALAGVGYTLRYGSKRS